MSNTEALLATLRPTGDRVAIAYANAAEALELFALAMTRAAVAVSERETTASAHLLLQARMVRDVRLFSEPVADRLGEYFEAQNTLVEASRAHEQALAAAYATVR